MENSSVCEDKKPGILWALVSLQTGLGFVVSRLRVTIKSLSILDFFCSLLVSRSVRTRLISTTPTPCENTRTTIKFIVEWFTSSSWQVSGTLNQRLYPL